jgi:hypothetical protein
MSPAGMNLRVINLRLDWLRQEVRLKMLTNTTDGKNFGSNTI